MKHTSAHRTVAAAAMLLHMTAHAVNGALPGGNGIQNASMGGTSIALPLDATAAANNPAGLAVLPTSVTLGLQLFSGRSSADYVLPDNHLHNHQTQAAPEGGFNWRISTELALGLSLAGAGAGSNYGQPALPVPGAGVAQTTLRIAEITPAIAWQPRPGLALGLGLTLGQQQFKADGTLMPAPVPGGLAPLVGHGLQSAQGIGLRVGFLWQPSTEWSFGLTAKSRTRMGRLAGYRHDLLAYSDGRMDLPSQYGVGVAWKPTERLTLAADWLRILWGDVKVMQDPKGFQWHNQAVLRLGAAWKLDEHWTLRAGISRNRRQIDATRVVQNLLVPSVHDRAYTLGVGWRLNAQTELNLGIELNPRTTLYGMGPSAGSSLTSRVRMGLLGLHHTF